MKDIAGREGFAAWCLVSTESDSVECGTIEIRCTCSAGSSRGGACDLDYGVRKVVIHLSDET